MSKKPLKQEAAPAFPICSKWENKYFYCMFQPGESYVLRSFGNLASFQPCADSSVITPENEVMPYSEFVEKADEFINQMKAKLTAATV